VVLVVVITEEVQAHTGCQCLGLHMVLCHCGGLLHVIVTLQSES
jgi:hypothetical protein